LYSFFHNDLRYFFCVGIEQHDIHAEGLVGQLFAFADFLPDDLRRSGSGTDDACGFLPSGRYSVLTHAPEYI